MEFAKIKPPGIDEIEQETPEYTAKPGRRPDMSIETASPVSPHDAALPRPGPG
jgi:hypothetical protein